MKIGDLARATGLTVDTLRYYEDIGLLPPSQRDRSGHRIYGAESLRWLEFVGRLKATGMGIADMVRYAQLRAKGPSTNGERRRLMEAHRAKVALKIAELSENLGKLDEKIAWYRAEESATDIAEAAE
ncbi:MerR family transcriptional regulator [Oryzibacter oryziterrae]|uniref:MerR family transcriptional regulator n=1 Tax=Oryzibacter oryziterrae TaxID=2766474 RepID=UPI001F377156|nr:MerR family transcriptional regulator [Oryzibacter oryziterrae]